MGVTFDVTPDVIVNRNPIAWSFIVAYIYRHKKTRAMSIEIKEIDLSRFDLSLSQIRMMHNDRIVKIQESMWLHGQLQPVVARVHNGAYQLIDGFKRYYSACDLMMETLQCRVLEVSLAQAKILVLSYNHTLQTMETWEEALILQDLQKTHQMNQTQLAKVTGHSRSWVSRRLSLIEKIDPEVASEIMMGALTGSHARALIKLPRGNQGEVARTIIHWNLPFRQSNQLVEAWLKETDAARRKELLEHPEYQFFHDDGQEDGYPYDERLSSFGNEMTYVIKDAIQMTHYILDQLSDERMSLLNQGEKVIITPQLQRASRSFQKLSEALSHAETLETPPSDEK